MVTQSQDSRLTLACTSREHRASLLTALRASSSVVVSPFLSVEEREGKKFTYKLAKQLKLRVVDRGDRCGLLHPRSPVPPNFLVHPMSLPLPELAARLPPEPPRPPANRPPPQRFQTPPPPPTYLNHLPAPPHLPHWMSGPPSWPAPPAPLPSSYAQVVGSPLPCGHPRRYS